ncbi:callose synthase 12 isoform X2 [Physcomitrium patens]|uniref:1,3-beta-glucan synthase n=1 Tax=Physcomitrium patens TaxID=3218 RepID=A0A7I4CH30_PHYPA|nr:callose synthase 12-like isoform X2 [Physcomitrium patens]|eukprot:XP_024361867.1 callose synthase 12-like isoform X2 [Physcomitrella patens]
MADRVYNILPVDDPHAVDHAGMMFPEVKAAMRALQEVDRLPVPPDLRRWTPESDMLDWLGGFFGFQEDNVRNQREHLVLLLANGMMHLFPSPSMPLDTLETSVVKMIRKKVTGNYVKWCKFIGCKNNLIKLVERRGGPSEREPQWHDLMYTCLFLLIWGEAANLRFMPECLCFIYDNMLQELNKAIDGFTDNVELQGEIPTYAGPNGFLNNIIVPIYEVVKAEADSNNGGAAPHSSWRNYDDMNEYFWSSRCFEQLRWPFSLNPKMNEDIPYNQRVNYESCSYLIKPLRERGYLNRGTKDQDHKVGKTGFVEQRSFWYIFRSFDRIWVAHILVLQASVVTLWHNGGPPWIELQKPDPLARFLSIFITWSLLRVLQGLLDIGSQYSLVSKETVFTGIRMILKPLVAAVWAILFIIYYRRMWWQRNIDQYWSGYANDRLHEYLYIAAAFIVPEVLALVLFILPWLRNFVENSNWRIFHALTWWFQTRQFVGRGLREGVMDNLKYALFWLSVLASKCAFSYWLQIRPLIAPTKQILRTKNITYKWHEFFPNGSRAAIVVLWAPVLLIRNVHQLRLRFKIFPSAFEFNLMPPKQLQHTTLWENAKDLVERFRLRYGWSAIHEKVEWGQREGVQFAHVWNLIVNTFRDEDLISDRELELLEIPSGAWRLSVFLWPSALLANQILQVLTNEVQYFKGDDTKLWGIISKHEYRRCAVTECYESIKHILLRRLLKVDSQEHKIIESVFKEIDASIAHDRFTTSFVLQKILIVHDRVVKLIAVLMTKPTGGNIRKVVDALQNLYEDVVEDFIRDSSVKEIIRGQHLSTATNKDTELFMNAVTLPSDDDAPFFKHLSRIHTTLSTREPFLNVPKGLEARRRISFFSNSLFMTMPRAPQVDRMLAFSVLTPYYTEEVIFSSKQLKEENEDGITILFYLQRIFPEDWLNFLERMKKKGLLELNLWDTDDAIELRLWASYRGQTLARTVRGMMYYERALQVQAFLDTATDTEMQGIKELLDAGSSPNRRGSFRSEHAYEERENRKNKQLQNLAAAGMKFTYVVTCQIYGNQKKTNDYKAADILRLMKTYHTGLRIAYVDEIKEEKGNKYYSVLVKYDKVLKREVEIYRIQLPGPLKLGEGKPENQNHALIFTRGDGVQTIDMNQEMYFEEAMKMRNLLEEFNRFRGIRKPTILGVREHVFTGSVSSLAWFMSAQETVFVTLNQRVYANPLKIRMHYGHPDVFDRLWFLGRGGISKASRSINISEDIFAGFNCTLRGGTVTHHEYIQAGKGRDVGLNQIAMFEAKVASGNGEQMLSRDVYRLGHHLDFFRMFSFYYTTVGFFVNNLIIVLTVFVFLWGRVYLALSGIEKSLTTGSNALSNAALTATLNQQLVVQLGLLTALPMLVEYALEHGFTTALWNMITMQLQLASLFFTFEMGTRSHYFGRTLLHGGAKYRATGRTFVVKHEKFAEIYRLYSRSHFTKGIELLMLLFCYLAYGVVSSSATYMLVMISSWFLAFTWIMAPFIFNPSGFDWLKTVEDFDEFLQWIWFKGDIFVKPEQSWEIWWEGEQTHLKTTGLWGKLLDIVLDLRLFLFQYGIVYHLQITGNSTSVFVYLLSWSYMLAAILLHLVISNASDRYAANKHGRYRLIQTVTIAVVAAIVIVLATRTNFTFLDILASFLAFLPTGWGILQICLVLRRPFLENSKVWGTITAVARLYDLGMGMIIMAPVAFLSWLPGFQAMQTRILYNEAFSRGLQISRLFVGKKNTHID